MPKTLSNTKKVVVIFFPFMLAYMSSELFRNINGVVAPVIKEELNLSSSEMSLMTAMFLFAVAGMQIISGILLDKYGCRITVFILMLLGAFGSFLYSTGDIENLYIGRFLLGVGMAACWTAAFKINSELWSKEKLPLANGLIIGLAGIGALMATYPMQDLLNYITWQQSFSYFAIATVFIAVLILLTPSTNSRTERNKKDSIVDFIKGFGYVLRHKVFITVAPLSIICQGVWLSYQGLWSGLWLRDVNNFDANETSIYLMYLAFSVVIGNLLIGLIVSKLVKLKLTRNHTMLLICLIYILSQIFIYLNIPYSEYIWIVFGFCVSGSILAYAIISISIDSYYSGRALSLLNLLATLSGFLLQYLIGYLNDLLGDKLNLGHEIGLLFVIVLQCLAFTWMVLRMKKEIKYSVQS